MKKLLFLLTAFLSLQFTAKGQLDARSASIYYGNPQKLEIVDDWGNALATILFDKTGRITSAQGGDMETRYEWSEDGKRVIFRMYKNGNYMDANYIDIQENTNRILRAAGGGVEMVWEFCENGRIDYIETSQMGIIQRQKYIYDSDNAMFPSQIIMTDSRQPQIQTISKQKFGEGIDAMGNAIEWTAIINEGTMNEISQTVRRTIYYYQN